jgi:hypothetical protein
MKKNIKHEPLPVLKIHVVRSDDMGKTQFDDILHLINNYSGKKNDLFSFIPHHIDPNFDINDEEIETPRHLDLRKRMDDKFNPEDRDKLKVIFNKCKSVRENSKVEIEDSELLILLTNQKNPNFLSYCDSKINNVFILTNGWNQIFESFENNLPIIYEIYAWVFRKIVFQHRLSLINKLNTNTVGCITDFCQNKSDFKMKIRTADIQPEIMNLIKSKKYFFPHIKHILAVFELIRHGVLNRERSQLFSEMVKIRFSKDTDDKRNIIVPEYGGISLGLEAIERAIYQLIIQLKEVYRNNSGLYSKKLIDIYKEQSDRTDENMAKTIQKLKDDPDSMYQKVSKINNKLRKVLPDQIVDEYLIHNDDKYFIKLSKDYYEFDEGY